MSNTKTYIGIDPGKSGAMCILPPSGDPTFVDFSETLGMQAYAPLIPPDAIVGVEFVHAMPGQGVSSMFTFGTRLGEIHGMLQTLDIPFTQVRPRAWQKHCGVEPKSGKTGIHASISQLYPTITLTTPRGRILDGRCDALGIAHYIKEQHEPKETDS